MNSKSHAVGAGLAMSLAAYYAVNKLQEKPKSVEVASGTVVAAGGFGAPFGSLPDLIEPASNPHHRQFFHSVAFGIFVFEGLRRIFKWQPNDDWQRLAHGISLIAGGAYLVHPAMESTTPRSLPLIGRLELKTHIVDGSE